MKKFIFLVCFLIGGSIVLGLRYVQIRNRTPFVPRESTVTLESPSQALQGVLNKTDGTVEQLLRENEDYQQATQGGIIRQGEAVKTGLQSSALVSFAQNIFLSLRSDTEISFSNLVPPNVLFQQRTGTIDYQVELKSPSVSVRALHVLFQIEPGNAIISVEGSTIIATAFSGSVKIGIVDLDNNTQVYTLTAEQRAVIDDESRSVSIE